MVCYSSYELLKEWRYTINQDFTTLAGKPFPYAENGRQQWGDEFIKLGFEKAPKHGCISSDGSRMALAIENDVHVIDTRSWDTEVVLRAHLSEILSLAFKPDNSNILVTGSDQGQKRNEPNEPATILVWKLSESKRSKMLDTETMTNVAQASSTATATIIANHGLELTTHAVQELEALIMPSLRHIIVKYATMDQDRMHGRLATSFQSNVFSPSGKWMVFLPGERPVSNSVDTWDIRICTTSNFKEQFTLSGHTDAIMWTGWSNDESFFGSVSWDGSVRIWDANTGRQMYNFETERQNWTGAFSPDSRFFAATDGLGRVRLYDLGCGGKDHEYWIFASETPYPAGKEWKRALSWHPDSRLLAVGSDSRGELLLLDVQNKEVCQQRTLLPGASRDAEPARLLMQRMLGVSQVKYTDDGHKLAVWTYGDSSIEVYDFAQQVKWRFARGGTEDGPHADAWRDEDGKVTSLHSSGMMVEELREQGRLLLASLDFDVVRVWSLNLSKREM
jgi:WD40 repeat protein